MRPFKFRAWDLENKLMTKPRSLHWLMFDINNSYEPTRNLIWLQYTGLKDNLGAEVYEGDIVAIYPLENEYYATVEQTLFGWCFKHGEIITSYLSPELFRVVGNIYENKYLIEVEVIIEERK